MIAGANKSGDSARRMCGFSLHAVVAAQLHRPGWLIASLLCAASACASDVTGYLPLNLQPRIEADVERLMVLADQPVIRRPIALNAIEAALPAACEVDEALCARVQREIAPWQGRMALGMASFEAAIANAASGDSARLPEPNQHGQPLDSKWAVAGAAYAVVGEHIRLNAGGVAYQGRTTPTGSYVSAGWSRLQLDIGYRDRWWSPLRDSSMLQSTEAPTLLTAALSNPLALTRARIRFEGFVGELSRSDRIEFNNQPTSGRPILAGLQASIEPWPGWSISGARQVQYGGGARPGSLRDFYKVLINSNYNQGVGTVDERGNEQISISTALTLPGPRPLAVYAEFAAEDSFHSEIYRFGNAALSAGIFLPKLTATTQLRYEFSNWEDVWYTHHLYLDGLTNYGRVTGNWGADWRRRDDYVGGQSHSLQLGWDRDNGIRYTLQYRTAQNASYTAGNYHRAHQLQLGMSGPWHNQELGFTLEAGVDPYGRGFGRLAATLWVNGDASNAPLRLNQSNDSADGKATARANGVERFVDAGVATGTLRYEQDFENIPTQNTQLTALHVGVGVRRPAGAHSDVGMRAEVERINGASMLELRAIDYRYRFGAHAAVNVFYGFARYDVRTPAHGHYAGAGAQWRDILPGWDLNLEARYLDRIVRKKITPGEVTIEWPNEFWSMLGTGVSLSRRF
jgi:hypothetical protein